MLGYVCNIYVLLFLAGFIHSIQLDIIINNATVGEGKIDKSINSEQVEESYELQLERRNPKRDIKTIEDFWKKRTMLANLEVRQLLGNLLPLNEDELELNEVILSKKFEEYKNEIFPPSIKFPQSKPLIEKSEIFKIIRKIPKGANLQGSLLTSIDPGFIYQLTFDDNLYFRFSDKLYLKYSRTRPDPGWRSLAYLRNTTYNYDYIEDLNNAIKDYLVIANFDSLKANQSILQLARKYSDVMHTHLQLVRYKPNFIKILKRLLEIFYEDSVMYAELDFEFPKLYDLNGNIYNPAHVLRLSKTILNDFIKTHKDFIGVRFIYTFNDDLKLVEDITEFRQTAVDLWKANPNLIAGFGITIEREPLSKLVEEILKFPQDMKLFINAGFTKDWGFHADYNILDALILNTQSIGEPYAISKHPFLLEKLREQDIPIKFSPILAQTLNYIQDLRNHPLSVLAATNYPMVIGNLGGGFTNYTGLSYDWYEAYLAMTPRFCDIRCLKQFIINSWKYSSLSFEEKNRTVLIWQEKWNTFVRDALSNMTVVN